MKKIVVLLAITSTLIACYDKEHEAELEGELEGEITELQAQLEECQNGADKIYAKIKIAYDKEEFASVKTLFTDMERRHPESEQFSESKELYDKVVKLEEELRQENA